MLKTRQVYIISSPLTNKVYIGSTGNTLNKRLKGHKQLDCASREIINLGQYKISPLCIIKNCSRKEIEIKEKDFRDAMKDIVVNLSGMKGCKNKDYKKPWELDGRKKDWFNIKHNCLICGGRYSNSGITNHERTKKHQAALVHEP
jgi:hypothetical protein